MPGIENDNQARIGTGGLKALLVYLLAVNLLALGRGERDAMVWGGLLAGLCGPAWILGPVLWRRSKARKDGTGSPGKPDQPRRG
jgi:hypothetical protein